MDVPFEQRQQQGFQAIAISTVPTVHRGVENVHLFQI